MGLLRKFIVCIVAVTLLCTFRTFVVLSRNKRKLSSCSKVEGDEFIHLTTERWQAFRKSLTFKTISYDSGEIEALEMERLLKHIMQEYSAIFKSKLVTYQLVADYSLLIHVQGKNKDLPPYMLAAHLDVVPVNENLWTVSPFNATEDADGTKVYGRGAIDDKGSLTAQLAALEFYLKKGRVPERSFYLAYGHDEESMGEKGAGSISRKLMEQGVNELHFLLDEGMVVMKDVLPGIEQNLASIGVTEKGYLTINISVEYTGGHSSMPGKESSVSIIGKAVEKLQSNQMRGKLDELIEEMLTSLVPVVGFPLNVVFSNIWLFRPVVAWYFSNDKTLQGVYRTTTAPTIMQAGSKSNVIPSSAWAVVNHRIHPMDSKETVINHVRNTINDERVKITELSYCPPHPISPFDRSSSLPYQVIADTAEQLFENAVTVPALLVATTDTKHYLHLTKNVYRFNPVVLGPKDLATIHAEDEVLSKENYQRMMNFYYHLFINADRTELRNPPHVSEEL